MVDGRTAVAIWKFESGPFAGVKAAAVIESPANLSFGKQRTSRIFVDGAGADISALLGARVNLGTIKSTQIASIELTDSEAKIEGMYEAKYSSGACSACTMPGQLWYSPLDAGARAEVKTIEIQKLAGAWSRRDEAAAFFGSF
jgi:hypothetical protein